MSKSSINDVQRTHITQLKCKHHVTFHSAISKWQTMCLYSDICHPMQVQNVPKMQYASD